MPSDNLIEQYGPVIIFLYIVYSVLPNLVNQVMKVINENMQSRAAVAQAPYELAKTVLSTNAKNDLIAIELIGIRASQTRIEERQDRIEESVGRFLSMFEEFLKSNKEQKP